MLTLILICIMAALGHCCYCIVVVVLLANGGEFLDAARIQRWAWIRTGIIAEQHIVHTVAVQDIGLAHQKSTHRLVFHVDLKAHLLVQLQLRYKATVGFGVASTSLDHVDRRDRRDATRVHQVGGDDGDRTRASRLAVHQNRTRSRRLPATPPPTTLLSSLNQLRD